MAYLPSGIDLRHLYLPSGGPSRLTLRRLYVLILGLPWDAPVWVAQRAADAQAEEDRKTALIDERQAYWAAHRKAN